jgi:hypothetical protein
MATVTWTGGSGDGNWNTGGNWAGGAAPSGADDVVFNTGASSVTTGPSSALAYATVTVTSGYSGSWGTSAVTPLFGNITGSIRIAGRGAFYKFSTGTCPTVDIEVPSSTQVFIPVGTITTLNTSNSSNVEVAAAVTTWNNVSANCTALSNGTAITTLTTASPIMLYRSYTTANVEQGGAVTSYNAITGGTLNVRGRGAYNHQSTGTITTANLLPRGMLTARGARGAFTITTLNEWANSMADIVVPGVTVTVGTRNFIGRSSDSPVPDPGL